MNPKDVGLFFKDPRIGPTLPDEFGTLYLLRRDIQSCMDAKILWPGAMCIMAGIDLLGKCLDGNDSNGKISDRFCNFAGKYIHLSSSESEILYQLRNSLLHSFGLYSNSKQGKILFRLEANGNKVLIDQIAANHFRIDIICLHEHFEKAVAEYHRDMLLSRDLQDKFARMFVPYGKIPIG